MDRGVTDFGHHSQSLPVVSRAESVAFLYALANTRTWKHIQGLPPADKPKKTSPGGVALFCLRCWLHDHSLVQNTSGHAELLHGSTIQISAKDVLSRKSPFARHLSVSHDLVKHALGCRLLPQSLVYPNRRCVRTPGVCTSRECIARGINGRERQMEPASGRESKMEPASTCS